MKHPVIEEEVVISGIGCKLPESESIEEFAEKLFAGENMVTRDDRKLSQGLFENLPEYSGKIRDARKFDYTFFGISNIVVQCMDPMTQQILERTFEAVVDAGMNPYELRGTDSAVFSGTSISDFDLEWATNYKGGYGIMGRNRCMNANRVSYWLDLKGTSMSTDSTWANGVTNILNGWDAVRKGRCETAIVSTANLQSNAEITIQLNDLGFLNPKGVCHSFDDSANGYARSDAVVVLVLQKASIARRSYATIAHVWAKCFGDRECAIQRPLMQQWEELFEEFYSQSKINPDDICFLEGHGSGIKSEDEAELKAVTNFFGSRRKSTLLIGSVKSNMGHAEASAAFCGLVKALVCFERGVIPQNLHFAAPNSEACHGFQNGTLKMVDQNTPFPEGGLIAINSQGFGGVYGHMVLKPNKKTKSVEFDEIPRLVLFSGRTSDLMEKAFNKLESLPYDPEYISLVNKINSKKMDKYLGRGYTILPKKQDSSLRESQLYNEMKRPVWFIFSGMGSQWPTMGKALMILPLFRESIERSHKILEPRGLNLIKIITEDDPAMFENILHSFVGIAAIQIALVDILNALKIVPDGMIGHSVGELGCAYADGCFTAEQMILSAYSRGRASIESNLIKGYMAAIGKGYAAIKDDLPEGIEVACHNASDSCTISGPAELVTEYVKVLESQGVFAKTVNVSNIAYHSRYIKPAAPRLLKYLKDVIPKPKLRSSRWISTSNIEENWNSELARYCSAEYHTNNLLSSVLFEEGCKHIPNNAICIEIAPHGLLQAILKRSLGQNCTNISLTRRGADDPFIYLLQAIGKLFMTGLEPQVENIYPKVEYPVSRGTPSLHQLVYWDHDIDLTTQQTRTEKKVTYSIKSHFLKTATDGIGYIINGENTYPVGVFLELVWSVFATLKKMKTEECPVIFENIRIESPMVIHPSKNDEAMITLQKGTGDFEINTTHLIARGTISLLTESSLKTEEKDPPSFTTTYKMSRNEIYNEFKSKGYDIGENFMFLSSVDTSNGGWRGEIGASANWIQTFESAFQLQILQLGEESMSPKFPKSFEKMTIIPQHHLKYKSSLSDSKKLIASYDVVQNVIRCGGLKMKGFQVQDLPLSKSTLKFTDRQFTPFMYPQLKDAWLYIDFCVGIVVDNMKSLAAESDINVLEFDSSAHSFKNYLEANFPHLKIKVQTVPSVKQIVSKKNFDFIICSISDLEKCATFLNESGLILTRTVKNQSSKISVNMELVSRFTVSNNEELWLIKKKVDFDDEPEFIHISNNEAVVINKLHGLKDTKQPVYLVRYEEPERGIENFKKRMQAETTVPLKWIFILQGNQATRDTGNNLYRSQVKNGLVTNVLLNGTWGFFLQRNYFDKSFESELFNLKKLNKEMSDCCLGIDHSRNVVELNQIEFSGKLKKGLRVMGIGSVLNDASIVPDKYFTWNLPESWSLEDGATVPFSYAFAYHCLISVGNLKPFESLLVTDGCTPLGLAMIEVGLSVVPRVYVTVSNEEEAVALMNRFPSIPRGNIIFHSDKSFYVRLGVLTKGENPEMIINQLEGDWLMSTCNCITKFGRIFHFGADDYKKNVQLGTSIFLLSTAFYSMSQEVLSTLRIEEKQKIHTLMEKGIKTGVVKPLPRKTFSQKQFQRMMQEPHNIYRTVKYVLTPESLNAEQGKLEIDFDCSYLIIGDETEVWIDVMRCLIRKGARKIVICHNGHTKRVERHANIIKKYNIVMIDEKNVRDVQVLFAEAQKLGTLAAVFVLALKKHDTFKLLMDLDKTYRDKNGYLAVISREGGALNEICTRRYQSGLPSTNFIWGAEEIHIGRDMDIMNHLCGTNPVFHVSQAVKGAVDTDRKDETLREMLPNSVEDLCKLGASLSKEVRITELPSLGGIRRQAQKEVAPLIFIGGMQSDPVELLQLLTKNLIYPAYCVHLPNMKMSIKNMVAFILPRIFELRREGNVFNLVGLSSGCYVAIEVAKQIEEIGGSVGLILIDCPHHTFKQNKSWESEVINILQSLSNTVDRDALALDKTWAMKVSRIMISLNLTPEEEDYFEKAVEFIRSSLSALIDYDLAGTKLLGPLTIVKPENQTADDRTITRLCNSIYVRSIPGTGREALLSSELKLIINGSAVSQSMSKSTVNLCSWRTFEDFLVQQKASDFNSLNADFRVTATKLKFSFTH